MTDKGEKPSRRLAARLLRLLLKGGVMEKKGGHLPVQLGGGAC